MLSASAPENIAIYIPSAKRYNFVDCSHDHLVATQGSMGLRGVLSPCTTTLFRPFELWVATRRPADCCTSCVATVVTRGLRVFENFLSVDTVRMVFWQSKIPNCRDSVDYSSTKFVVLKQHIFKGFSSFCCWVITDRWALTQNWT